MHILIELSDVLLVSWPGTDLTLSILGAQHGRGRQGGAESTRARSGPRGEQGRASPSDPHGAPSQKEQRELLHPHSALKGSSQECFPTNSDDVRLKI